MKLYQISDNGDLFELNRLDFKENDVYLVDDMEKNTVYMWVGLEVPEYKKDITAAWARRLDKERGGSSKILIMKQKREYGSFLAMMEDLRKGLIPGNTVERRPELILEKPKKEIELVSKQDKRDDEVITSEKSELETRILAWLNQIKTYRGLETEKVHKETEEIEEIDFETQIREAAYFLSLDRYTYDELCWMLAEKIQKINMKMPSIEDIRKKAEEVFNSSSTYDELCWLNAEMDVLILRKYIEKEKKPLEFL
ncbi:MAG: hypothetical protein ACFE85_06315 [Candidatus Hodarchaeota archaeon]